VSNDVQYEIRGTAFVISEGKYVRVDLSNRAPKLADCLHVAVAQIASVVMIAEREDAWPQEVLLEQMAEITISLRQIIVESDQGTFDGLDTTVSSTGQVWREEPCLTKACPHRLAMQHQDDDQLLQIVEDNTLAEEGVS